MSRAAADARVLLAAAADGLAVTAARACLSIVPEILSPDYRVGTFFKTRLQVSGVPNEKLVGPLLAKGIS
tara:strand:- start:1193 stop:1402 length:210 start_codon:yes stop_codon:yes gene_type:complete